MFEAWAPWWDVLAAGWVGFVLTWVVVRRKGGGA